MNPVALSALQSVAGARGEFTVTRCPAVHKVEWCGAAGSSTRVDREMLYRACDALRCAGFQAEVIGLVLYVWGAASPALAA